MRRIVLWGLSTFSALVLLFGYSTSTSGPQAGTSATPAFSGTASESPSTSGSSGAGASGGSGASPPNPASGSSGSASSKTVTGSVAQTQWGPVQLQLVVKGQQISKVSVLQYPQGNGRDAEINNYALPILIQETVDAQSAQIDMVSGATVTSSGYLESLQSALDRAGL